MLGKQIRQMVNKYIVVITVVNEISDTTLVLPGRRCVPARYACVHSLSHNRLYNLPV